MATPRENNDDNDGFNRHLDNVEGREIVFCHLCSSQWYRDDHGLICPACEGEITEIVSAESDPRPPQPPQGRPTPPEFSSVRNHYPFQPYRDDSDPEEEDIENHIHQTPHGFTFTRNSHGTTPLRDAQNGRRGVAEGDVMGNFQSMISNLMGPQFAPNMQGGSSTHSFTFGGEGGGPRVSGARWTFTTGGPTRFEQHNGTGAPDFDSMFGGMMGGMGSPNGNPHQTGGLPGGLASIFAQLLNPANARSGDAVYTQEALDNIISQLMEQNTSNAPGPASDDAINSLPTKKLDEKMLGSEGKGECSVCMDDVTLGDEVVVLPCTHWFHQQCASVWLKEHNTCPICRKSIDGSATNAGAGQSQGQTQSNSMRSTPGPSNGSRRLSQINRRPLFATARIYHAPAAGRMEFSSVNEDDPGRNESERETREARLRAIRNLSGRSNSDGNDDGSGIRRVQVIGDGHNYSGLSSRSSNRRSTRPREDRRNSERSTHSSRREESSRRASNSQSSGSGGGLAGAALGWLRNRLGGNDDSRSSDGR